MFGDAHRNSQEVRALLEELLQEGGSLEAFMYVAFLGNIDADLHLACGRPHQRVLLCLVLRLVEGGDVCLDEVILYASSKDFRLRALLGG